MTTISRLFASNLSGLTSDDTLRGAFERFGAVTHARVVINRGTGESRGFGFVSFANAENAASALREMSGVTLDGNVISVAEARPRDQTER
ncbi:MAG TPA: RNA-binding protein [Polyangiaceae bacterium]|jgi:RNA recognition motif-containing protein|nr:RNA-binding protein [Polyangiaceae bacterium]